MECVLHVFCNTAFTGEPEALRTFPDRSIGYKNAEAGSAESAELRLRRLVVRLANLSNEYAGQQRENKRLQERHE